MKINFLKFFVACLSLCLTLINFVPVQALNHSTYGDLTSSNSNANNLINYAYNYKSFKNQDFIIYQESQYSYYICWGDITFTNNKLHSDNVEYINYTRTGANNSYSYVYNYGSDKLDLNVNHVILSNIDNVGSVINTYKIYQYNDYFIKLLIFSISLLFAMLLSLFRR